MGNNNMGMDVYECCVCVRARERKKGGSGGE